MGTAADTTLDSPPVSFSDVAARMGRLTAHERETRLAELELARRRIDAEMAALVDAAERDGDHRLDGHRSPVPHLRTHLNCASGRITRLRQTARLLREHPVVGEQLSEGWIGLDQTHELARAFANPRCGHRLGDSLDVLLGHARRLKFDEFRLVIDRWMMLADLDGAHTDRGNAVQSRRAMIAAGVDGVDLYASGGTALQAYQMQAILDAFTDKMYRQDQHAARDVLGDDVADSELARTHAQRSFDALVKIFHLANNSTDSDTPPAVTVNVVIDQHSFETQLAAHGLAAEPSDLPAPDPADAMSHTSTGLPVHPDDIALAALLGHVRRVVVDAKGVVIDLGERSRLFTGSSAQAARLLVTMCEHPGCTLPEAWCQIDHLTEWEHRGPTDQDNAAILCGHHNRVKHRRKLRARRDRHGRVRLQRPDGTWITPIGADPPAA